MFSIILIAALTCPTIARDSSGNIARSTTQVRTFMRSNPCPDGVDKGKTDKCGGYVVDHVIPLCLGGKNDPSNMQWQTDPQGIEKDKAEVSLCRWVYKACGWKWR